MQYLLTFLEGVLTFISPCILPMLPLYVFYFMGHGRPTGRGLCNALAFVLGFTTVFVALGIFSAFVGGLLIRHQTALNLITGFVVILFGLGYLGILPTPGFLMTGGSGRRVTITGALSAYLFGLVFSVSWTPCVGAFLGSALMLASRQGSLLTGLGLLLCYSAGLGIPFLLSALFLHRLKAATDWIKAHYRWITRISGVLLIVMGVLMATGTMSAWLSALSLF